MIQVVEAAKSGGRDLFQKILGQHQVAASMNRHYGCQYNHLGCCCSLLPQSVCLGGHAVGTEGLHVAVVDDQVLDLHPHENVILQRRDVAVPDLEVLDVPFHLSNFVAVDLPEQNLF